MTAGALIAVASKIATRSTSAIVLKGERYARAPVPRTLAGQAATGARMSWDGGRTARVCGSERPA